MNKKCKNKKCQKPLPADYKYKYCEHCRNEQTDKLKQLGKVAGGVLISAVIAVVTKGKFKPKNKS